MSTPRGPTPFASVPAFTPVPGLRSHSPLSAAHVQACSAVAPGPALSTAYTLALLPSHIPIASPRLGNATSRLAVAGAGVIAIAVIAIIAGVTVATNAKAPRSGGRNQ
jgi:hypothetical protein